MPSAAKSPRLRRPYSFFVDRALGGHTVVESLRRNCLPDESVYAHDDHFAKDTDDVDWLADVGKRGWVVFTKDIRIRTNANEREALLTSGVALFALPRGDLSGEKMSEVFCPALNRIRIILGQYGVPLIATITADVIVTVRTANGHHLDPVKVYRPKLPKHRAGGCVHRLAWYPRPPAPLGAAERPGPVERRRATRRRCHRASGRGPAQNVANPGAWERATVIAVEPHPCVRSGFQAPSYWPVPPPLATTRCR